MMTTAYMRDGTIWRGQEAVREGDVLTVVDGDVKKTIDLKATVRVWTALREDDQYDYFRDELTGRTVRQRKKCSECLKPLSLHPSRGGPAACVEALLRPLVNHRAYPVLMRSLESFRNEFPQEERFYWTELVGGEHGVLLDADPPALLGTVSFREDVWVFSVVGRDVLRAKAHYRLAGQVSSFHEAKDLVNAFLRARRMVLTYAPSEETT